MRLWRDYERGRSAQAFAIANIDPVRRSDIRWRGRPRLAKPFRQAELAQSVMAIMSPQ
jgi:hypothetical protein